MFNYIFIYKERVLQIHFYISHYDLGDISLVPSSQIFLFLFRYFHRKSS